MDRFLLAEDEHLNKYVNEHLKAKSRWDHPIVLRKASVAPMMDITDRHFRRWIRCISADIVLYTEMVTTGALLHGDRDRFLRYHATEQPIALQLGGNDPKSLAQCAAMGQEWGYQEINLNVGCPSDRVQEGRIGACLMAEPEAVSDMVSAMLESVDIPVTVKTRLGIDDQDSYPELCRFINTVHQKSGCRFFSLHARKAWLNGLSPKQNREIPPLHHDWVYRIKSEYPELLIELNGGVQDIPQIKDHLKKVDSVMVGRAANDNPWIFQHFDRRLGSGRKEGSSPLLRSEALKHYEAHILPELGNGTPLKVMAHHTLNLFQGIRGAKSWRQAVSRPGLKGVDGWKFLIEQAQLIETQVSARDQTP
jgi:tRNA-dihydrouridine synthase A